MKKIILFIILFYQSLVAQTINGNLTHTYNREIVLNGFNGLNDSILAKTTTDSLGNFTLKYAKEYQGAGILQIGKETSIIILLNNENIVIQWDNLQDYKTLKFLNSFENNAFSSAIIINQEAENKLSALHYLVLLYDKHPQKKKWINLEIAFQEEQFTKHLNQLPNESYIKYYLKIRKLVSDYPLIASRNIERLSKLNEEFNSIDFNDVRLQHSGLLREVLDGYFQLVESIGVSYEMYKNINTSVDAILKSLSDNANLQQEVAQHLFSYFELRSLFPSAEYLALKMLNQSTCLLTEKNSKLFEHYRKLGIGKTAPNISLHDTDLKKMCSTFKLVVFGASWCPTCQNNYPALVNKYATLRNTYDLEIIYISIDTDEQVYSDHYKEAPFITYCDTKGWETSSAKDYCVFATPTYFLLDTNLKILAKIKSPEHLLAWLDVNGKSLLKTK